MKKIILKATIVLCLFTICAVTITHSAIRHSKRENAVQAEQETIPTIIAPTIAVPTIAVTEQGIDLYGTYDENDVLIQTVLAPRQDDTEIKIPQLDGLKDLEVQAKINQDIYNRIGAVLREYPLANYGDYYVRGNFANVLSISFHIGDGNKYEQLMLNYNLVTGEQLVLEDLFLEDADITQCIRSSFYDMLALNNMYDMEGSFNATVSPDENEVYKLVKGYISSEEQKFMFTPAEIYFYYGDYVATLRMIDVADQIAVYSRFETEESIFTRDDIGYKNIFTCADTQYDTFKKIEYGYLEPNFWYDITIWNTYMENDLMGEQLEKYLTFEEMFFTSVEQRIEEFHEVARNNPDKFYMLFLKPGAHVYYKSGEYSNIVEFSEGIELYEMPMEVYEETYRDKLIETYRYEYFAMRGGAYIEWSEGDGAIRQTFDENKLYNYMTGEAITELKDVFREGSGYEAVIRNSTKDSLGWKTEYSWSEIEILADQLQYRLDGTRVYVTIPALEDFYCYVFFSEFEEYMLKIFE